jgi:Flp pilus assembly protein TadB
VSISQGSVFLLVACALVAWPRAGMRSVSRVRALRPPRENRAPPRRRPGQRWLLPGVAGVALGLLVGGAVGLLVGAAAVVGVERLLRAGSADDGRAARAALLGELPAACDLLAVCLAAGIPVAGALAAVGRAVPPPLGPELVTVAGLYRLGADPRRAWADAPEPLAGLGRVLVRTGDSGAAVAPALRSLAADARAGARAATESAVRRAGVWVLAPLGLCFLPAFVCLGVAPLVLGIAAGVFG